MLEEFKTNPGERVVEEKYVALYHDRIKEPIGILEEGSAEYLISLVNIATRGGVGECPSYHTEPLDDKVKILVKDLFPE